MNMQAGAFGYVPAIDKDGTYVISCFEKCREEFQKLASGLSHRPFVFCHRPKCGRSVALFIDRIERMVHASPRSVVGPTQYERLSYVRMSSWWRKNAMRWSLFTALLRAGQNYDGEVEKALLSFRYTRQTMPAVRRFLRGYTRYTGCAEGWNDQFFHNRTSPHDRSRPAPDEREIRTLLVTP